MKALTINAANRRQTALYSFYGAIAVSLFLMGFWWLTRPQPSLVAVQRRLTSLVLTWKCPKGHSFQHTGSTGHVPCPVCGRRADVAVTYMCPRHGERPALVRYVTGSDGRARVSAISFHRGVWTSVGKEVLCPDCGVPLSPKMPDVFSEAKRLPDTGTRSDHH